MDVPLHLRLAYARSRSDVYADRRTAYQRTTAVAAATTAAAAAAPPPASSPAPLCGVASPAAPPQEQHWLSSLLSDPVGAAKREPVLWYADPAVNVSCSRRGRSPATTSAISDATGSLLTPPPPPPPAAAVKAADPDVFSSPFPLLFEGSVEPLGVGPDVEHNLARAAGTHQPARLASALATPLEDSLPSSASLSRTAASPPVEAPALLAAAAAAPAAAAQPMPPAPPPTRSVATAVQADTAADAAAAAHVRRVREELAGTHEARFADVAADLERRLRECVLTTVALDEARQQLLCAFQLPIGGAAPAPTAAAAAATARADAATSAPSAEAPASPSPPQQQQPCSPDTRGNPPAPPALVANGAGDSSLSAEARTEMALHLYGLRRQVQQLRRELDAHESVHGRQVNALRAAAGLAQGPQRRATAPPVRVEVVRAYEEDPVPYRKGPWREANFAAAAATQRDGVVKAVSGVNVSRRVPGQEEDAHDDGVERSYSEDDFTEVTSAASSSVRTDERGESVDAASSSSASSIEALFRQRQAAALRARNQPAARATAATAAAAAAAARPVASSDSSTPLTTTRTDDTDTDDTDSTLTSATRSTTASTSDTDSDSY